MPIFTPTFTRQLAGVGLIFWASWVRAEQVVVLTSGDWPPYMSQAAPYHGPISHIVTAAFALEGIRVQYLFRPWNRAYTEAAHGAADGSIIWSTSANDTDRNRQFFASDPVFEGLSVFFHLKSTPFQWRGDASLMGLKIGGTAGYEYRFDKIPGIQIDRSASSDQMNFRKLVAGRFDLFPANLDAGLEIIRTTLTPQQAATITWEREPYNVTPYRLLLNKKAPGHQRLMEQFNRGLKRLKESGKYAQYLKELPQQ